MSATARERRVKDDTIDEKLRARNNTTINACLARARDGDGVSVTSYQVAVAMVAVAMVAVVVLDVSRHVLNEVPCVHVLIKNS